MRTVTLACLISAVLTTVCPLAAQTAPLKIAVASFQGAIVGTKDGQKASRDLDAKVQPKQKEFAQRQSEIAQLEEQLSKGSTVLSEEKRNQMIRDVDQKKKKLERDIADAQESLNAEQQRLLDGFSQKMISLISNYAKDHGYALVLDDGGGAILYASSAIDITQDLISAYDKMSEAPQKIQ